MSNKRRLPVVKKVEVNCDYCNAPCCQLIVELTPEECTKFANVDFRFSDGSIRKTLPTRESDGLCVYFVPGKGCSTYDDRPSVCLSYSCGTDTRITTSLKYGPQRKVLAY